MSGSATPFADYVAALGDEPSDAKVFPCGGKAPLTEHGHKDASNDPAQLRAWANKHPTANVGLDPHSLGLCVVDIDGPEGEASWAALELEHGYTPATYTVRTPHGRHLYFRGVLPTTAGKLAAHIDTRGSGTGYVLIPPSVTADGGYSDE